MLVWLRAHSMMPLPLCAVPWLAEVMMGPSIELLSDVTAVRMHPCAPTTNIEPVKIKLVNDRRRQRLLDDDTAFSTGACAGNRMELNP